MGRGRGESGRRGWRGGCSQDEDNKFKKRAVWIWDLMQYLSAVPIVQTLLRLIPLSAHSLSERCA